MRIFTTLIIGILFLCLTSTSSKLLRTKRLDSAAPESVELQPAVGHWNLAITKAQSDILRGGLSGAAAGLVQVLTLMWLRTTINYQYRFGKSMLVSIRELYAQGGLLRFYKGVEYAIIQGPLSRFGAVAANELGRSLTSSLTFSTLLGTVLASLWRFLLMPIDTCKTVLQVEGSTGFDRLYADVLAGKFYVLYHGSSATFLANMLSHYPWFLVHNFLENVMKKSDTPLHNIVRNSCIGFLSSAVADVISNSMRVIKTYKQSSSSFGTKTTYMNILRMIISEGGLSSLFGRGLTTRILANGVQSIVFTITWKYLSIANSNK